MLERKGCLGWYIITHSRRTQTCRLSYRYYVLPLRYMIFGIRLTWVGERLGRLSEKTFGPAPTETNPIAQHPACPACNVSISYGSFCWHIPRWYDDNLCCKSLRGKWECHRSVSAPRPTLLRVLKLLHCSCAAHNAYTICFLIKSISLFFFWIPLDLLSSHPDYAEWEEVGADRRTRYELCLN